MSTSRDPRGGYPSSSDPISKLPKVPVGPAPGAHEKSEGGVMTELPKHSIETRVRYVFNKEVAVPGSSGRPKLYSDDWFGSTPDGAASYPWLMKEAIAWVEERVVYEPGDWGVAPIENGGQDDSSRTEDGAADREAG